MDEKIDTSKWPEYIIVKTSDLTVKKVEHEVVEWEATFCSEDDIRPYGSNNTVYYAENETQADQMKKQWERHGKQETCIVMLGDSVYFNSLRK